MFVKVHDRRTLGDVSERHNNKWLLIQGTALITDHREKERIPRSLVGTEMNTLELHSRTFVGILTRTCWRVCQRQLCCCKSHLCMAENSPHLHFCSPLTNKRTPSRSIIFSGTYLLLLKLEEFQLLLSF